MNKARSRLPDLAANLPRARAHACIPQRVRSFAAGLAWMAGIAALGGCADPLTGAAEPMRGRLEVEGSEIALRSLEGTPAPPAGFELRNVGDAPLTYVVEAHDTRFRVAPAVGTLAPGRSETIDVAFASRDLPPGTVGPLSISVTMEGSARKPVGVSYELTVEPDPRRPRDDDR